MYCKITGRSCTYTDNETGLCGTINGKCIYEEDSDYREIEEDYDDSLDELDTG